MSKFYKKKTDEERKKEVDLLIEKADKKIEELFTSDEDLKEYLDFMGKFYNYSYRNSILIQQQFKGAIAVGSYAFWKEKGFTVNKGEKGIGILVPIQLNDYFIVNGKSVSINKASKEQKELIEKGEIEVFKGELTYKKGYIFDVSQTNATEKDLPKIFPNKFLDGNIENYNTFYKALENVANKLGTKIIEPKSELGVAKGVSYKGTKEVALNQRNSEVQNIKTLIHELAHSKLHRMDNLDEHTRAEREYQAEMVAYTVTSYFNIAREDYSLNYIKSWTKNATLNDKKKLLEEVKKTSREFIEVIEETLVKEKEIEYDIEKEIYYNKNLYEEKEIYSMNLREVFNDLKEKVMTRVNEIIGQDNKNIDVEKELREIEKEFTETEKKYLDNTRDLLNEVEEELENTKNEINIEELTLDDIGIKTPVVDKDDREQFLKFGIDDLMKKYSDEISDSRQKFMEKRGLQLRGFVEEFLQIIEKYKFVDEDDYLNISFEKFLDEELEGYSLMEQEKFEEETYMDRWERQTLGEEEYLKTYGKNNAIDSYMPYYVRAYTVYENINKDKLYEVSNDITLNDKKFESGEQFTINSYNQGRFIIEFPNRNIKEKISFDELQSISNILNFRINEILELEKYFNDKNIDNDTRKELNKNEKFIELLDKKVYLETNIINLKEDIKYYSNESQYNSLDEMKNELKLNEELSSFISKEINRIAGSEIEEVKYQDKEYTIKSDIKLEDGSFVKKGTSFFIEEFKEDNFKVHFENRAGNTYINNAGTGEGHYFSENEILRYADLSKTKDLIKEKNIEKEKPLEKDLSKNNSFSNYKKVNYYDVNRLKEIPIKEVCEQLGLELKSGSNNKLWTKIRNEKSSSCCINLDKNYWYDFGVGYGGDTIKLVEEVKGISSKEAIKELAEMFGIDGETVKNNFYLSKDDYKLIGIEPDRATLNLDINLEKQSIEELKEIEKIYGRSMNELANYDKDKFLKIIKEKSLPVLIENVALLEESLNKYKVLFREKDKPDLEVYLYKKGLDGLDGNITKKASILKNIGLEKECDEIMKYKSKFEKDIKKYIKENSLENVFVEVKNSEIKEIQEGMYKFTEINRELEIKEAIVRKIRADEYFPMLNLNLKVDTLENKIEFNVNFKVGDGKTSDLIEEIKLLENENAINFIKEYDRELRNIGHSKSQKEVIEKIEKHEEWLRSNGKSGECLDLSYKNLDGIEIRNKDLRHSNFKNCTMSNCVIYADLTNANLKNIELKNTRFIGSKLTGVKINPTTLDIINTQISEEENKHYKAKENLKTNKLEERSLRIKL